MKITGLKLAVLAAALVPLMSDAGPIVDLPDTDGYGTFLDTATNRVWLDLGALAGTSVGEMIATSESLGFTFATMTDVAQLLSSLPLNNLEPALWNSYADIMGISSDNLIWGAVDDGATPYGDSATYSFWSEWQIRPNQLYATNVDPQLGIWAYRNAVVQVSETGSIALLGLGLAAMGFVTRTKKSRY